MLRRYSALKGDGKPFPFTDYRFYTYLLYHKLLKLCEHFSNFTRKVREIFKKEGGRCQISSGGLIFDANACIMEVASIAMNKNKEGLPLRQLLGALLRSKYGELIRFTLGGIATTAVNWIIYIPFYYLLFEPQMSEEAAAMIANAIAWLGSVIFAFVVNRILVFHSKEHRRGHVLLQFLYFTATRAVTGLGEIFLPSALMGLGMHNMLARLVIAIVLMIFNYLTTKFIAFKK